MVDSAFDPNTLLNMQISGANDTKLIQVPAGEYMARVKDVKFRKGQIKQGDRAGETFIAVDVTWAIDDQHVKEATGLNEPTVRQGLMLDLTAGGGIDLGKGRNVGLGKLRAAVGKNDPSQVFTFDSLKGCMAKVKVGSRRDERQGSPTFGEEYAEVNGVAPLMG